MDAALERLRAGVPILIFPEGTRSPERRLHRFHPGAFQIAARAGVPLVPLLITCDPPTLKRGAPWYCVPERTVELRVTQLPSLPPSEGDAGRDAERARRVFDERLHAALLTPPPPTLEAPKLIADL
jgi:1-acyl-sn-glycerol-3-phosphate acyltransferase